jgi:hypothetical protein
MEEPALVWTILRQDEEQAATTRTETGGETMKIRKEGYEWWEHEEGNLHKNKSADRDNFCVGRKDEEDVPSIARGRLMDINCS